MTPDLCLNLAINPALRLLPGAMTSPAARAEMLAIGLQESEFKKRRQMGGGPARGFWQFERLGGVVGVLTHHASQSAIRNFLAILGYAPTASPGDCYLAIEHNDVLAAGFARCLLWTLPDALATVSEPQKGWDAYAAAWKPRRPRRETWDAYYAQAWGIVSATQPLVDVGGVEATDP